MTVAALASSIEYLENGVTLAFPAPFRFKSAETVKVSRILADGSLVNLAYGVDYSVSGGSTDAGGTVTLVGSVSGAKLRIRRATPRAQSMDYTTGDRFPAESHELALDTAMLIDQEQDDAIVDITSRAITVQPGQSVAPIDVTDFIGKFVSFGPDGQIIPSSGTGSDPALRLDLASLLSGASLVAWSRAMTALSGSVAARLKRDWASPKDAPWNAVGDGVADDTAAVDACAAWCAANKITMDGGLDMFGYAGNFSVPADDFKIEMLRLRQLTPNSTSRRTFFCNKNRLKAAWIEVDRNGLGTQGSLADAAGIWIAAGLRHDIQHLEAYGNGKGTGVAIVGCTDSVFHVLVGRNIAYDEIAANDDRVQGVWLTGNNRCFFGRLQALSLSGNGTGGSPSGAGFPSRFTRGAALSGNSRCTIASVSIANVDQGVDLSGSDGNVFVNILGGNIKDCATYGLKVANSGFCVNVSSVLAEDCGIAGFVVSGPSEAGLTFKGEDINFYGCRARNPGSNQILGAAVGRGFWVATQPLVPADIDFPKNVNFYNCIAEDTQNTPTMNIGFHNEVLATATTTAGKLNQLHNCKSIRHITAAQIGFHTPEYSARGTGNQSIGTSPAVVLLSGFANGAIDGNSAMYDPAQPTRVTIRESRFYTLRGKATFAANGSGFRRGTLKLNGNPIAASSDVRAAVAGTVTPVEPSIYGYFTRGDEITFEVEQNSGGALNVDMTQSYIAVLPGRLM